MRFEHSGRCCCGVGTVLSLSGKFARCQSAFHDTPSSSNGQHVIRTLVSGLSAQAEADEHAHKGVHAWACRSHSISCDCLHMLRHGLARAGSLRGRCACAQAAMARRVREAVGATQWTLTYQLNSKLRMQFNVSSASPHPRTLLFQYSSEASPA